MKANNQLVVLSGILVLLATATIAASNIVQPANAAQPAGVPNQFGKDLIATADGAHNGDYGSQVKAAQDAFPGHGIADLRANGDKNGDHNFGTGGPNFR